MEYMQKPADTQQKNQPNWPTVCKQLGNTN